MTLKHSIKLAGSLNKKYLIKVACGESHVVFLTHAGMVFTMGECDKGQLGIGDTKASESPVMITSLLNYRINDISVGGNHNIVVGTMRDLTKKSSNSVASGVKENTIKEQTLIFVWGDNSQGQLGIGSENELIFTPTLLEYLSKESIKKIATGECHSLVLTEDGKLFGFGSNKYGQLLITNNLKEEISNFYIPSRIKFSTIFSTDTKQKFSYVKCSSLSTLLITEENILIIGGKFSEIIKSYKIKLKEGESEVNLLDLVNNESSDAREISFVFNNEKLHFLFDKLKYNLVLEDLNITDQQTQKENNKIKDKINLKLSIVEDSPNLVNNNDNYMSNNVNSDFVGEFEVSKDFFSDNASTNELFENNNSFEQTIEELRNYISLVGISFVGDAGNTPISFRPKNLPRKTPEEEYYHRQLVEENRKMYLRVLKEKQIEEKKLKEKANIKKLKLKKLQSVWENTILPEWFKRKKDYNFLKYYFYEGIPANLRGRVWLLCIGNNFSITPEYYEIEVKKAVTILKELSQGLEDNKLSEPSSTPNKYNIKVIDKEKSIKYIELDIERTFPYLGIFKNNSPLGEDLTEILQAFVASRPDIGYVQGLSYLAGMLLLNMDKYQAFVALMNITLSHNIIPFYRFDESQIRKRIQIFKQVFYHNLPELCDHFESLDILPEHYLIEWNMTIFSKNLNIDISTRLWDIYMLEGVKAIYQASIVILSHFEKKFYTLEFDSILKTLKSTNNINFDEDQLVEMMKGVKFPLWVSDEIQKLNDEYIPLY